MNIYISGSLVRTTAMFVNSSGQPADPTSITLKYKAGAGTIQTVVYPSAPLIRDATGGYHADLDTTGWIGPGIQPWLTEWIGTGVVQAINIDTWGVEAPLL